MVAKLLEKFVFDQINHYLNHNDILTKNQYGFRKSHSTLMSPLNVTNNWLLDIDQGLINGVRLLDLRKAFDMVDHQILINEINIEGIIFKWLTSYLTS